MELFKVSGVNRVYFYDKNYLGSLDESSLSSEIPLVLSSQAEKNDYQVLKQNLCRFLHIPKSLKAFNDEFSLDEKVMHFSRKSYFNKLWSKISLTKTNVLDDIEGGISVPEVHIPKIKVKSHVLLCCSANKPLAEKIAESLRERGEMVRLYHVDGQGIEAKIPSDISLCGSTVTIVQSTRPNPDEIDATNQYINSGASSYFFEALIIARQAHLRGAAKISLLNPYQFNARSDKAEDSPNGKTGAYVQHNGLLLKASGINQVITAECHDLHTMSGAYTGIKMRGSAIAALSIIASKLVNKWISEPLSSMKGQVRLVTPDAGAAKRTKELTQQLQTILGNKLCEKRILGEKQRDSHQDNSALISSLNSGDISINRQDKYLITDDETATGSTLCQAINNLRDNGAQDISVIIAHNNMSLNWLERQLCLARFLYIGANDLHFSDTHEMGSLANNYQDLIQTYAQMSSLSHAEVEKEIFSWFEKNILSKLTNKAPEVIEKEFSRYKLIFKQLNTKVQVHSLATEFANKVMTKPYMANPYAFKYKVDEFIRKIKNSQARGIMVFEGVNVPVASAVAQELNLPLQIVPLSMLEQANCKQILPKGDFALISSSLKLQAFLGSAGHDIADVESVYTQDFDGELFLISNNKMTVDVREDKVDFAWDVSKTRVHSALAQLESTYLAIKANSKFKNMPVKLLGIGVLGQALAGQLSYFLNKKGLLVGVAAAEDNSEAVDNKFVYSAKSEKKSLRVDRNSLNMGEVCIAVSDDFNCGMERIINELVSNAKVYCPFFFQVSSQKECEVKVNGDMKLEPQGVYATKAPVLFFQPNKESNTNANECSSHLVSHHGLAQVL